MRENVELVLSSEVQEKFDRLSRLLNYEREQRVSSTTVSGVASAPTRVLHAQAPAPRHFSDLSDDEAAAAIDDYITAHNLSGPNAARIAYDDLCSGRTEPRRVAAVTSAKTNKTPDTTALSKSDFEDGTPEADAKIADAIDDYIAQNNLTGADAPMKALRALASAAGVSVSAAAPGFTGADVGDDDEDGDGDDAA